MAAVGSVVEEVNVEEFWYAAALRRPMRVKASHEKRQAREKQFSAEVRPLEQDRSGLHRHDSGTGA